MARRRSFVPTGGGFSPTRRRGFASSPTEAPGLPKTLDALNGIFAPWGAAFSHAWNFSATSGAEADLATSGAIPLSPEGALTQGVVTGLPNDDRGVQIADGAESAMAAPNGTDLNVTTGSVIVLLTARFTQRPTGLRRVWSKMQGDPQRYEMRYQTDGSLVFIGGAAQLALLTADHSVAGYRDILAIIDRTSATQAAVAISDLSTPSAVSATTLGDISSTARFSVGWILGTFSRSAPQIVSFLAWGTQPGTLVTNRVAALAAWRASRGT